MLNNLSWFQAIILSIIAFTTSFFIFLFLQVIWGDILKDTLSKNYQSGLYFNINVILIIGLIFVFLVSILINSFILRDYTLKSKFIANSFSLVLTFIILFGLSWLLIVIFYPDLYDDLNVGEKVKLSTYFFAIFSVYILPTPVLFWMIGLMIYHAILIIFIKVFFIKKSRRRLKKVESRNPKVDIYKYSMM